MDQKEQLEHTIDELEHTPVCPHKHELAVEASKIHQSLTGHAIEFDKDDNIIKTGPEACQCPALHKHD